MERHHVDHDGIEAIRARLDGIFNPRGFWQWQYAKDVKTLLDEVDHLQARLKRAIEMPDMSKVREVVPEFEDYVVRNDNITPDW